MLGLLVAAGMILLSPQPAQAGIASEETIEAPGPRGSLLGTFIARAGFHAPPVLILPGSGPTDRDGNNPLGVRASPYRLLAEALAERGIPAAIIDKRGMFASAGAIENPNAVTLADYAGDAASWIAVLRARTDAPCVWLAGHSEGGLVALIAAGHDLPVCGLLLLSAPGRPLGEIIRAQIEASPPLSPYSEEAGSILSRLERGEPVADVSPALAPLFGPAVQPFVIDLLSHDPAALAAAVNVPVLVLHGTADLQTSVEDARRLAAAAPRSRLVLLDGVNHVLKAVPADDRAANLAAYADPHLPLAPGVADAITDFIAAHGPVRRRR